MVLRKCDDTQRVLNGDKSKLTTLKASQSNLEGSKTQFNGCSFKESKNPKAFEVTWDQPLRLEEHIESSPD